MLHQFAENFPAHAAPARGAQSADPLVVRPSRFRGCRALRQILTCLLAAAFCLVATTSIAGDEGNVTLRVMSFNIRYGTADDGENHWKHRKEFLVETIRNFNPDLLGTQETLAAQRDELAAALPAFELLAAGRDDGADRGEMMALYYARDRFEKLDGGHFWLSESPEIAGSKSWDSSLPRMVTWVQLRDRRQPLARPILFLNTHFDHRGTTARLESARRIRARAARELDRSRIILTGDFNTGENSEPYRRLFDDVDGLRSPVVDTFRTAHPERKAGEGTFSNFKADQIDGPRIDWIGASRDFRVQSASIDRTERSGRTPSDHFPVTAVLAAN